MSLSRREIAKDVAQQGAEAALASAGNIVAILFDTAREITTEVGAFGTEMFEIAESSRRAALDRSRDDRDEDDTTHPGRP